MAAGIAGYYWLGDSPLVLRILAVVARDRRGRRGGLDQRAGPAVRSCSPAKSLVEVKKVVWPTRKETMQTTAAVFAFVVVMAVFLWISDKTLEWVLYDLILGWKKT